MTAPMVAILDDEPQIRQLLSDALQEAGFRTRCFACAQDFETGLKAISPDICLVDLGLPDRDGLALVHRLALDSGAAIIIISGRAQVQDRVAGLELGADDYIIKPFEPIEVVARVRARLRQPKEAVRSQMTARFGQWEAQFERYILVDEAGQEVTFSHAEGEVLRLFLENPRRLVTRAEMQDALGGSAEEAFDRAMDVRVSRLRTKLREDPKNPQLLKTIYGAGYIFLGAVEWV
ncbi:MAG: response regulator transcription factor [Mangrovicoccus sp.]|nr:response regulator transcription factor [Mangrovicoccus sp.]